MSSIFDMFMSPEALERQRQRGERTALDIKIEQDIKIRDELHSDFTAVKRYWSDVPEYHYASTAYKSYSQDFQEAMQRPTQLKCRSAYETRRLQALREEVELSKRWQQKQNQL